MTWKSREMATHLMCIFKAIKKKKKKEVFYVFCDKRNN